LFANKEKCNFCVESVIFLGFVVNKNGVHVDPTKIKAIQEWPTPKVMQQLVIIIFIFGRQGTYLA